MRRSRLRRWWAKMQNRDGVALALATAGLLIGGEATNPILSTYVRDYVGTQPNPVFAAIRLILVFFAFSSAFGSLLAIVAAVLFAKDDVGRGRFFLGLGVGFTLIGLISRVSQASLLQDWSPIVPLATTVTGLGVLSGVAAQIMMSAHAIELKKRLKGTG